VLRVWVCDVFVHKTAHFPNSTAREPQRALRLLQQSNETADWVLTFPQMRNSL